MDRAYIVLATLLLTTTSFANEIYHCKNNHEERSISLDYVTPYSTLPCRVIYNMDDIDKIIYETDSEEGQCAEKAHAFAKQHKGWGWKCKHELIDVNRPHTHPAAPPTAINLDTLSSDEINDYKLAAALSQVRMLAGPIKSHITQYYFENGTFPNSLKDIGMRRSDMKNSSFINDLRVGYVGRIYIKGNKDLGANALIQLNPTSTLGGTVIEWECLTNMKLREMGTCTFRNNIKF